MTDKNFTKKPYKGQQPIVTPEMTEIAHSYFVIPEGKTNARYIGPKGEYQKWYYAIHHQRKKIYKKKWRQDNLELDRERSRIKGNIHNFVTKLRALQKVAQGETIQCVLCKTTDIRVLTINHLNGDGSRDRDGRICRTYRLILDGRSVNDLDIRCHNCNILYEFELGRRKLPDNWQEILCQTL